MMTYFFSSEQPAQTSISDSYPLKMFYVTRPRRGGPQLKESQVYPARYAHRYLQLHCEWVATGTNMTNIKTKLTKNDLNNQKSTTAYRIQEKHTVASTVYFASLVHYALHYLL